MKYLKMQQNGPALRWGEAYPLGNGHIGAMVFGSYPKEEIIFTENTFYSGERNHQSNQPAAAEAFLRMRTAAEQQDFKKVHEEAEQFIGVRGNYGTNLPVGKLCISYSGHGKPDLNNQSSEQKEPVSRILNLRTGILKHRFSNTRETFFVSHPDQLFAMKIACDSKSEILVSWESIQGYGTVVYEGNTIHIKEAAWETMHCDSLCGTNLKAALRVETDGSVEATADGIVVSGMKKAFLYLKMETDFLQQSFELPKEELESRVEIPEDLSFHTLKERHKTDFRSHMDRVLLRFRGDSEWEKMLEDSYAYGRYLLLSSSRGDSVLPAHLQGIWNDQVACNIGWTCDMHLDINTQMNYWIAGSADLLETQQPLYRWMENLLIPQGRICARTSYGLEGWVAELVSNAWGFAAPYWASPIAPCPTGGLWIFMQYWEEFLYTRDLNFLKNRVFPLLEEAVRFFLGYVFQKEDGTYTCGPSISPENSFLSKRKKYQISNGCTYEIVMIRELFEVYDEASSLLNIEESEMASQVRKVLGRLLPYRVLPDGTLAEYDHDCRVPDLQHRHTSHLLGVFPFSQITPQETPELCEVVERTLEQKLTPPENWEDTGWARSLLILYEARLLHGDRAGSHLREILTKLREPNGTIYHPPTRGAGSFDNVYELDGNTGLCMGITEMLVQSHRNCLRFLPSIPKDFPDGTMSGVRLKGDIRADFSWSGGQLSKLRLYTRDPQTIQVAYMDTQKILNLKEGWNIVNI